MKKLVLLATLVLTVCIFLVPSICLADAAGSYSLSSVFVTMTEPKFNTVLPTDMTASSKNITISNVVWKDSSSKTLANTDKITAGGTYTVTFDLNRVAGDSFAGRTSVYINNSAEGVSKTSVSSNKMTVSKSFTVQGGRLSNANGKAQFMEGGEASTATTADGKKVLGLLVFLIDGNVEEGKALPTSFQLKTDLDTTFKKYNIYKTSPSDTSKPYAVWQQYDENAQADKSYTLRYIFPIPGDVSVADDCQISIDGNKVSKAGLMGSLFFDQTYKTGASKTASEIKYVSKVEFENFTWPVDGQKYETSVKLKDGFPGKITRYTFEMFRKSLNGTAASAGDNIGLCIYVDLNDGYQWADEKNGYLNGQIQDMRIHNDSMGTEWGFAWNEHRTEYTDKIKIEDQSPETLEYVEGEDVKLFVKATGADTYQWAKYGTSGGGIKQVFRASKIDGATKNEYVIEKASKDLDGAQYECELKTSAGERLVSKTIKLKLVEKKTEQPATVPTATSGEQPTTTTGGEPATVSTEQPTTPERTWSKASEWAVAELDKANEANLIPWIFEKEDLTKNITRREFAYVAVKLYEKISNEKLVEAKENPFTDTNDIEVLKALNVGITNGTSDTTFDPNALITREQMATMMTRALTKAGIDTKVDLEKVSKFADDSEMHDWGKASIYYMSSIEIIKGVGNNTFNVLGNATREQSLLISERSADKFSH
ncbi:MAG: S-layer homology domain-containing protein [Clostridia bacterium]|nr:S-layer homology domain-containing protein [Clostridia bacterium]